MQLRWILPGEEVGALPSAVRQEFNLSALAACVLSRNGFVRREEVERFLQPRLSCLSDPFLLPEMGAAVARIDRALRQREKIALYGDYDVDGVSALAILARLLMAYGGEVGTFLPSRSEEGYGLSDIGIERCLEDHAPSLLIAVDCGTNSVAQIAKIRARGIDVIVVDHHEFAGQRPDCVALVNPKCGEDFHYLCSAGLAFKVAHALLKNCPLPGFDLKDYLDMVAVATLADLVPLVDENRVLVRRGLRQLEETRWPGLSALMQVAGVRPPVNSGDVGFRLAPRINAAGRVGTAQAALQLLLTNDPAEAALLATGLDEQNRERQAVERRVVKEVEAWVDGHFDPAKHVSIVAGNSDWHEGVLGIVASRVMRKHHRPTLVVGFQEDGSGKGSGRSIEGLSLVEALSRCSGMLLGFGGHEMAAGLTLHRDRFEEFRTAFEAAARELLDEEMLIPCLRLDAELPLEDVGFETLEEQSLLEPYGMGNRQPLLLVRGVVPMAEPRIMKEKHLRITFASGRRRVQSVFFDGALEELPRPPWDVAFRLERNEYNGRVEPQMQIVAIRQCPE